MKPRLRDLPALLVVVALAFAQYERVPGVAAVRLFRGLAIQMAYRHGSRHIAANGTRAVLMWSEVGLPRSRRVGAEVRGTMMAVFVGLSMFALSNLLLLIPLHVLMQDILNMPRHDEALVAASVMLTRLAVTGWRAGFAFRLTTQREASLPPSDGPCWRIDYLAALPQRHGYGGSLLDAFLDGADAHEATVVLSADGTNRDFYRKHGFRDHSSDARCLTGTVTMVRASRTARRPRARTNGAQVTTRTSSGRQQPAPRLAVVNEPTTLGEPGEEPPRPAMHR